MRCMGNASLTSNQDALVMVAVQGSLDASPPLAKQMRQISQLVGGTYEEDILADTAGVGGTH